MITGAGKEETKQVARTNEQYTSKVEACGRKRGRVCERELLEGISGFMCLPLIREEENR